MEKPTKEMTPILNLDSFNDTLKKIELSAKKTVIGRTFSGLFAPGDAELTADEVNGEFRPEEGDE